MKRFLMVFSLGLLALMPTGLWAQMVVSPLSSTDLATGGSGTASEGSPFSVRLNPASAGGQQQVTFESSYWGLVGGQSYGNAFNLGLTWPQRWGVLTGAASYWGLDDPNLPLGHQGQLTFAFSKDLWEDLYIGADLNTAFGSGGWGVGLGLGFLHFLGDQGWFKNLRWGAALRDMGSAYTTTDGKYASPPVFTPALGAEFDAWKDDKIQVTVRPDLSLPSFQDLNLSLGSTLAFGSIINVDMAYRFDLRDTLEGTAPGVPISFGVSFHFQTDLSSASDSWGLRDKGWDKNTVKVSTGALPLTGNIWAIGAGINVPLGSKDTTAPQVKADLKTTFISPNNDGVQDQWSLPVSITDERFVTGYTLEILDADRKPIRTMNSRIELPEAQGLDQIVNRLVYVKHGVGIPPNLEWNGTTDGGTTASDGTYTAQITAWDDNGNTKTWPLGSIVVKNTPPQAAVNAPITEFNPVGLRNRLTVIQRGSTESQWTGTFLDAQDKPVLTKVWKNANPDNFDWDGRGSDGRVVPDGVYSYQLTSTDAAGNTVHANVANLIVNSVPTPIDLKINRTAFSPSGNGVKSVVFQPAAGVSAGLSSWKVEVQDKTGQVYKTFSGSGALPPEVIFGGKDEGGNSLSNGEYKAKMTLTYSNGNQPEAYSPSFTVKNNPPTATVTAPYSVFSPGSEEGRGVLVFDQISSDEDVWTGHLTDSSGKEIRTVRWPGKADATYLWDGRGGDGKILPDGTYTYVLTATDKAGNRGTSQPVAVTIDTAERTVLLASDRSAFTPASTGTNARVKFLPQVKESKGLSDWTLTVQDAAGQAVRTWTGSAQSPTETIWDGKNDSGSLVPDGIYTALLKTSYFNGTTPAARSNTIQVKNTLPQVTASADTKLFSPSADSSVKTVTITQTSTPEAEWTGLISRNGEPVKTYSWKGMVQNLTWDGTDDAGNRVPDGTYRYEVKTTDVADNTVSQVIDRIIVDTRPTPLFLTVGQAGLSPNGDGVADTLTINARVGLNDGIDTWKLELVHDTLGVRKTFQGTGPVPSQFVWDGSSDTRPKAEDGKYTAKLSVSYFKGNRPETKSAAFLLQSGPPQLALDLSPQPFSPDNDGIADELLIGLGVKSVSPVASWSLEILDPENHRFILFTGSGSPSAQLKWDGRSGTGETVQSASDYTAVFQVKDTLGNSASISKSLAVDVLVVKVGDRLKIIIPSITFQKNQSNFLATVKDDLTQEKIDKNVVVLKRLAEIFTKYQRYKIIIEGHANMVNWEDAAKAKREQDSELLPLSKARADAVKAYLVKLGIAESRISTDGVGGARPIVEFGDADNRWKNRRVEFWLDRE